MNTLDKNHEDQGHGHEKAVTIIVNAQPKTTTAKELSFTDVVNLAYDNNPPQGSNWVFTVTYRKGQGEKPEGTLVTGQSVKVKDGMIFNVTATDKS